MKKIISAILALSFCLTEVIQGSVRAEDNDFDLKYNSIIGQLVISGVTDNRNELDNPYITAQVCDEDGKLFGLNQAIIESDGSYKCAIGFKSGLPDNLLVKINAGSDTVSSVKTSFSIITNSLTPVKYEIEPIGNKTRYFVNLTDIYTVTDEFDLIIARYEQGSLKDVLRYNNDNVKTDSGKYYLDVTADSIGDESKVFVWSSISQAVPYAVTEQGFLLDTSRLDINFGNRDKELKNIGYYSNRLDGINNYEVYKNAVSEIPEEFDLVSPKSVLASYEIYVSPNGNDNAPGTLERPFKTLERAIRAYNSRPDYYKKAWTAIYLREGTYKINKALNITSQGNALLNISAYNNEKVTVTAASSVTGDKFKLVTGQNTPSETVARMSEAASGKVYYCDYSDIGINEFSDVTYQSLKQPVMSVNDDNMILARYPNTYSDRLEKVLQNGTNGHGGVGEEFEIVPVDKKPFTWKDTGKICMWSQMSVTWGSSKSVVRLNPASQSVSGSAKTVVSVVGSSAYPVAVSPTNSGIIPSKIYYFNVFEEIDMPGEWCFDDEEKRVYFYPENGQLTEADRISFSDSGTECIFNINKSDNIIINGLDFSQIVNVIGINDSENVVVQNCGFKNIEGISVQLTKCRLSGVINSEFSNVSTGVTLRGDTMDWGRLTADRNFIQNNICTNSRSFANAVDSIGNIISHNTVENLEGSMLGLHHSCENIIEYNDICAANLVGDEGGCIYIDGHVDSMYNHVRYNYIHDNKPYGSSLRYGGAVVVDDMGGNTYIYKNIIENQYYGISYNCGDNNIADSNTFINCYSSEISASSLMYGGYGTFMGSKKSEGRALSELRFFPSFYNLKLSESESWNNRYPKLFAYMAKTEELYNAWNGGSISDDSESMKFFRASTGNYFLNNTFVTQNQRDIGLKENVSVGKTAIAVNTVEDNEYISENDPNSGVPQFNGFDYNVIYNNSETAVFDKSTIDYYNKIGAEYSNIQTGDLNVICFENPDSDYLDLYWGKADGANYYKITLALDEAFDTIYNTTYTFNNYAHIKVAKSSVNNVIYHYRIDAYRADKNGAQVIDSESGSAEFSKKNQEADKVYIAKDKSNDIKNWKPLRRYVDTLESGYIFRNYTFGNKNGKDTDFYSSKLMSEENGAFVRLSGYNYSKKTDALADDVCWGGGIESNNTEVDSSTLVTAQADIRFPDEEHFPETNGLLSIIFLPSNLSPDKETGRLGNTVSFAVRENSDGKYTLYAAAQNSILKDDENTTLIPIKIFNKEELFGNWLNLSVKVDMENGIAEYCLNGDITSTKKINLSDSNKDSAFLWNCCSYAYSIDFVGFSIDSEKTTQLDIKNIEVKRVINK